MHMQVLLKFVTTQAAGEVTKFALTHFFYTGLVAATAGSFMLLSFAQVAPWPSMCARSLSELAARSCSHAWSADQVMLQCNDPPAMPRLWHADVSCCLLALGSQTHAHRYPCHLRSSNSLQGLSGPFGLQTMVLKFRCACS